MRAEGVADAAARLGVSERRVRQLLADGRLVGERIGRTWVIDAEQFQGSAPQRHATGRPWTPSSAWAVLLVADGDADRLSSTQRHRARRRLGQGLRAIGERLGPRAQSQWFYAHPSALDRLRAVPGVVRTGVSAATAHGSDLVVVDRVEAYVRRSDLDELVARFALDPDGSERNVLLRVVEDEDWPFRPGDGAAGRNTVAVDLLESSDPRTRRAGHDLLGER